MWCVCVCPLCQSLRLCLFVYVSVHIPSPCPPSFSPSLPLTHSLGHSLILTSFPSTSFLLCQISFWGIEKLHSFDSCKYKKIVDALQASKIITGVRQLFDPRREATREELLDVHKPEYLDSLSKSKEVAAVCEFPPLAFLPNFIVQGHVMKPNRLAVRGTIVAGEVRSFVVVWIVLIFFSPSSLCSYRFFPLFKIPFCFFFFFGSHGDHPHLFFSPSLHPPARLETWVGNQRWRRHASRIEQPGWRLVHLLGCVLVVPQSGEEDRGPTKASQENDDRRLGCSSGLIANNVAKYPDSQHSITTHTEHTHF